ncbi:hypothetical protein [Actinacidiphila sp. ITFR-21]|uniref:hypothetical protein n=1 Tax=Actinacidiphila sp. ITFR-21 TaxID=3075199 RepID=UPI00288B5A2F|nr:hypothetical protein [Streptomyces sp. ITFR-21]WNI17669.1 hypothetical protein RLT57_20480 [Streptomyces sp. ITFR-21]WNI17809.1 hypothetical protein RLT57_21195 [Streptomyces sp. ITFR-21]
MSKIFNCTEAARKPCVKVTIRHQDQYGRPTHITVHPNLLSPEWWGYGRYSTASPVLPGIFLNETGATK